MDEDFSQALDDSAPTCPTCLRQRDLVGDLEQLYWVCECGLTPVAT